MKIIFVILIITAAVYSQEFIENKTVSSDFYNKVKIANLLDDTKSLVKKNRTKVFREGLVDRGMNVCRDEDFYTPPTSVTPSENIIPREKIPGEEKRLPSSISLKLAPDTTYQGQMLTMRVDISNRSDTVLTLNLRRGLFQEITDKKTGKIFKSKFHGLGDYGTVINAGKEYTIERSPLQHLKTGLSKIEKVYSYWNYWSEGEYSYTVKYILGTSEVVSNSVDFIIKPIPEIEKEAFNTLLAITEKDEKYTNYNHVTDYNENLEKTCEKFRNSIFGKEFSRILLMSNDYYKLMENDNIDIKEKESRAKKIFDFIQKYPDDYFSMIFMREFVSSYSEKKEVINFLSKILTNDKLLFHDKIKEMKERLEK